MRRLLLSTVLLALFVLPTTALAYQEHPGVLANDGRVYFVSAGTYGDLFPLGELIPAENIVLAVDELLPSGNTRRLLVPGTLGPARDDSPSAAYDEASDSLALVWEKQLANGATTISLVSFANDHWSAAREITGHTQSRKWSPRVAIIQDRDPLTEMDRTVFHVTWAEGVFGYESTFYTPVLLVDGSYAGRNPVLRLADFDAPPGTTSFPGHALLRAPSEDLGGDRGTVVVGTASATTGRFLSFDLKVHPTVMGRVADETREKIVSADPDTDLQALIDDVRAHIIVTGGSYQPAALIRHLAAEAESSIRTLYGNGSLGFVADAVRAHIIIAGDRWLFPQRERGIIRVLDAAGGESRWSHIVTLTSLPGRLLPELDREATQVQSLLSGDGREALVAWQTDGHWRYVESRGNGWTRVLSVHPSLAGDPEAIERLFQRRIRSR